MDIIHRASVGDSSEIAFPVERKVSGSTANINDIKDRILSIFPEAISTLPRNSGKRTVLHTFCWMNTRGRIKANQRNGRK